MTAHTKVMFYENSDHPLCTHAEPADDDEAWDEWSERHPSCDDGRICLDVPVGFACEECSEDDGDMVPWNRCRDRVYTTALRGIVPDPYGGEHQQIPVLVGSLECLVDRECDDYFDENGNSLSIDRCSHIRDGFACSCTRKPPHGEYEGDCTKEGKH